MDQVGLVRRPLKYPPTRGAGTGHTGDVSQGRKRRGGPAAGGCPGIGAYRLLKRLGGGGMRLVFLGRSRGGRLVAVKLVRPELARDPDFRRRFKREVEAAQRVGGFYTAHVLDADPEGDPPWLVTAYIPGPSLQEAITRCGFLPETSLGLLAAGLAEGLATVHGCKVVHRDLKPGNVLLAADGPRLIDFGIARAADDTQLTGTGLVVGTPGFMAPEHIVGNLAEPAADVFSLGAVLAYAATGRPPFGSGAAHAVNYRVVHEAPQLSGVPDAYTALIGNCLAKDAAKRPGVEHPVPLSTGGTRRTRSSPRGAALVLTVERGLVFDMRISAVIEAPGVNDGRRFRTVRTTT
ncbi:serine/threonine-protein kinase [Streptomyces johnsoniae]|uniref:Serine/threonine-protein kinase n=1 Tax=Streptomyces johnsoniae TaxID=3075532 RepID=A0ABU2SBQ7_9ACTN|nr:serine/threonine-protein kinase [Streptomyces sp. DSM 41886]MDT0446395.1 serine/threonine-protein kinase [Streptomyces sp. DSM 41886]